MIRIGVRCTAGELHRSCGGVDGATALGYKGREGEDEENDMDLRGGDVVLRGTCCPCMPQHKPTGISGTTMASPAHGGGHAGTTLR